MGTLMGFRQLLGFGHRGRGAVPAAPASVYLGLRYGRVARRRALVIVVAGVALTLVVTMLAAAPASAGPIVPGVVTIRSPAEDGLTVGGRVRVVVRAPIRARRFRVVLDRREITNRFRRRGRLRVATLRRLRRGPHAIWVAARDARGREGYPRRRFVAGRRAPELLGLARIRARVPAAPVVVTARLPQRPLRLSFMLNGRRLGRALAGNRARVVRIALSPTHGLRAGVNRLGVTAYMLDGRYDVERRAFRVSGSRPLAAAGLDRRTRVGRMVILDARASRASGDHPRRSSGRQKASLRYRWRLVARPRGSRAVLHRAKSRRPRLVPDRPGRYRASLVVTERRRTSRRAARAADATPGLLESAPDTVDLYTQPDWDPIGGAVDMGADGGISIGGQTFPEGPDNVQVLVVERGTPTTAVSNKTYVADKSGMETLQGDLKTLAQTRNPNTAPSDYLVLIRGSGPGGQPVFGDPSAVSTFAQAITEIGAQLCGAKVSPPCLPPSALTANDGNFSVIGVPGSAGGSAWMAPSLIEGWLQVDQSGGAYTFVPSEHVPFRTTTSPTQASVTVGGQTTTSSPVASGSAALFAVVYDARELSVEQAATLPLGGSGDVSSANAWLAQWLYPAGQADYLVALQTIGPVNPQQFAAIDSPWWPLAQTIEQFGGTGDVFLRLTGGPYALLGGTLLEGGQGAETAPGIPITPSNGKAFTGTLSGMLSRHADWRFHPDSADPTNLTDYTVLSVANDPPVPWPDSDAGHAAANGWIAEQLKTQNSDVQYCATDPSEALCDIRDGYVAHPETFDNPVTVTAALDKVSCPPSGGTIFGQSFTAQDCNEMIGQFQKEWPAVARVRQYFGDGEGNGLLQKPLALDASLTSQTLTSVTQAVVHNVKRENADVSKVASIFGDVFWILSSIGEAVGVDEGAIAAGLSAGIFDLSSDTITGADGANALVGTIQTEASKLIDEELLNYSKAAARYSHIADLVVSDSAKLQAAQQVEFNWPDLTNTDLSNTLKSQLQAAALQWFYEALLPTFAKTYDLGNRSDPTKLECRIGILSKWHPFDGTPQSPIAINYGYATDAANVGGTGQLELRYRVLGRRDLGGDQSSGAASLPGAFSLSLMDKFPAGYDFTSSSQDPPAGFFQPWLYRWTFAPPSPGQDACAF
jgi:hypothetical protein